MKIQTENFFEILISTRLRFHSSVFELNLIKVKLVQMEALVGFLWPYRDKHVVTLYCLPWKKRFGLSFMVF